jgi:hypothetical protein
VFRPGAALLGGRSVHFEYWGMAALAEQLGKEAELRPWLAPRRMPVVRLDGQTLHMPSRRPVVIEPELVRLLTACDGRRSAREIVRELLADAGLGFGDEAEIYELLEELAGRRVILWTLEIPTSRLYPERILRERLEEIPASPARERARGLLGELEAGREEVAAAAGDGRRLGVALAALEEVFVKITGAQAVRRSGETYAGRGLVYEDGWRDVSLELGAEFRARLGPVLTLLLVSARWYTFQVAERYRELLGRIYDALCREMGEGTIDYLRFWQRAEGHFNVEQHRKSTIVEEVTAELMGRWGRLLGIEPGARRVERDSQRLRAAVVEAFAAPHPGWPGARYHSPDVLVAAQGLEAFARGDYVIVIGELHVAANTLLPLFALAQHPRADELVRARGMDVPGPSVVPVEAMAVATRADHLSPLPHDVSLEMGPSRSWRAREETMAAAELVVERIGAGLCVRTRDGQRCFDAIAFLEQYLMFGCLGHFALVPPAPHVPRVMIDGVVIQRETWRFVPAVLRFAWMPAGYERFVAVRGWARAEGLPRHVFVKVPEEQKPCYVDLGSPILVDLLAKLVRKASAVTVSEMLPDFEGLWLHDAAGAVYTSELRLAAVDPEVWAGPAPAGELGGAGSEEG